MRFSVKQQRGVDESFLDPRVIPRPGASYVDVTDIKWITSGRKEATEKMLASPEKPITRQE